MSEKSKREQAKERLQALGERANQERGRIQIAGRGYTDQDKARLDLLDKVLSAIDAGLAALAFGERLDAALDSVVDRLHGPLQALVEGWHEPPSEGDAELAGHAEARVRSAVHDLSAIGSSVAATTLPSI